jgi:hypothetical protein
MMDMSAAALPPRHGPVFPSDTSHPLYPEYRAYRNNMTRLMVEAAGFRDWLVCRQSEENRDSWARHPEYPDFIAWMRQTRAGGRHCRPTKDMPYGLAFPENFKVWLTGERW